MRPSPSPRPPAVTISVHYDDDVPGATEALLTLLRTSVSRDTPPDEEHLGKEDLAQAIEATAA